MKEEMLRAAAAGTGALGDQAASVAEFVRSQRVEGGGYRGRSSDADLYYAAFGASSLFAIGADDALDGLEPYLRNFGGGDGLDLVHLACLARCRSLLPAGILDDETHGAIRRRIEAHRSCDGAYAATDRSERGSVYACFLATAALQDLGEPVADIDGVERCTSALAVGDGSYANDAALRVGTTPGTAAAVTLLRHLARPVDPASTDWLLAQYRAEGGFVAAPAAPEPDLLSTAVALHALAGVGASLEPVRDACLHFVGGLLDKRGAFRPSGADDDGDCEYAFYGLLSLGHLG